MSNCLDSLHAGAEINLVGQKLFLSYMVPLRKIKLLEVQSTNFVGKFLGAMHRIPQADYCSVSDSGEK